MMMHVRSLLSASCGAALILSLSGCTGTEAPGVGITNVNQAAPALVGPRTEFDGSGPLSLPALEGVHEFAPDVEPGDPKPRGALQRRAGQVVSSDDGGRDFGIAGANPDELLVIERAETEQASTGWRDRLPRGGTLQARLPGSDAPLVFPLEHTDVDADITIYLGTVRVRQTYHNPYAEKIEAVYVFPLPQDAAVRDFLMKIGERTIRGIIREREEAQRIYEEARRQGYVASLMTQERPNVFTQAVANIEPEKEIDIDITYFHSLRYADGVYEFVFPMVVGPRFNPPGFQDGIAAVPAGAAPAAGQPVAVEYLPPEVVSTQDVTLAVRLDARVPIRTITSPTHAIEIERDGETRARVRLKEGDTIPNRDFVLCYDVSDGAILPALATHADESGGYFSLVLHPPQDLAAWPVPPREMVFVLDCSGSMSGAPLAKSKEVVRNCLGRLRPVDSFQIIRFSESSTALGPAPLAATAANIQRGLAHLESLQSEGGTMMIEGIKAALDFPHDPERYRIVAFLTDGYIGNDREIIAEARRRIGAARLFSFGIGSSVNRFLLAGLARAGRGEAAFALPRDEAVRAVDAFFRRIEHPALTDVEIDWGGAAAPETYPREVPDLFAGRPVTITGRFAAGAVAPPLSVRGRVGGAPVEIPIAQHADGETLAYPSLASVWARAKIGHLHDAMYLSPYPTEEAEGIKLVALQYGLLSDFTAFVAVDSLTRTAAAHGTTIRVPVAMPEGVRYETTVGAR